jgi:hypothetical protein
MSDKELRKNLLVAFHQLTKLTSVNVRFQHAMSCGDPTEGSEKLVREWHEETDKAVELLADFAKKVGAKSPRVCTTKPKTLH